MTTVLVTYTFTQGRHPRRFLFERVSHALYMAVQHLHEARAEPATICWGQRVLYDCAAIERVWQACRAELEVDRWHVPAALASAGRQELRQ